MVSGLPMRRAPRRRLQNTSTNPGRVAISFSYIDPKTRQLPLCFLTTNDITGGNSGSPMFNGKGELIGLAFDGNWDALSSDISFDSALTRCIGVDIRYVLWLIDHWGHADHLIHEILKDS